MRETSVPDILLSVHACLNARLYDFWEVLLPFSQYDLTLNHLQIRWQYAYLPVYCRIFYFDLLLKVIKYVIVTDVSKEKTTSGIGK